MNRQATRQAFKDRALNISLWCKKADVSYATLSQLFHRRGNKILFTKAQMVVVQALRADGLYVPSEDETEETPEMEG